MNLRDAAQQALEALERLDEQELATGDIAWLGKEIGDLSAALANTQDWDEIEALHASLREHMAEIHRLRAAGRQALEALCLPCDRWNRRQTEIINASITTLRAALAEDRSADTGKTSDHIADADKMVEPVAWPMAWIKRDGGVDDWGSVECGDTPLYLAPPKREPLTDEEIEQCCYDADQNADDHTDEWTKRFARAIERAHGIGG